MSWAKPQYLDNLIKVLTLNQVQLQTTTEYRLKLIYVSYYLLKVQQLKQQFMGRFISRLTRINCNSPTLQAKVATKLLTVIWPLGKSSCGQSEVS